MPTTSTAAYGLGAYVRHRPEDTLLYEIVQDHLDPFLAHVREQGGRPLPRYVEREFREYLRCGILAHGFLRLYCDRCGKDLLVAFSCKGRGLCPSCGARRMSGSAAQLADRVLPDVPLRQWVLSVPFELRLLLASKAEVLSAVIRIFIEEVFRWYTGQAKSYGLAEPKCGAVTFTQRFGGSLNLNVHLHVIVLDGVYHRNHSEEALHFHPISPPSREDLTRIVGKVARRVFRLLHRKNLIDKTPFEERSNESADHDVLQACFQAGVQRGLFATPDEKGRLHLPDDSNDGGLGPRGSSRWTAEVDRFNVHAGVTVAKGDRGGRERLGRYVLRPSLSLQRLSRLPDGRIAYRLRYPGPHGHTHRVMTPLEFIARVSALIPPPKFPLVRYHGVLAPNSPHRRAVVPVPPDVLPERLGFSCGSSNDRSERRQTTIGCLPAGTVFAAPQSLSMSMEHDETTSRSVIPNDSLKHTAPPGMRIAAARGGGTRIDWARLLKRVFNLDILACPCGGRLRVIAEITERRAIDRILNHLGEPRDGPTPRRVWDPMLCDVDLPPPDS